MGALREKMIEEMKLRSFAPRTQKSYVAAMVGLARHYRQFPDQLTQEQIRTYLLHLQDRGLSVTRGPPRRTPLCLAPGAAGACFYHGTCVFPVGDKRGQLLPRLLAVLAAQNR